MRNAKLIVPIAIALASVITLLSVLNINAQVSSSAVCQWTGPTDGVARDWSSVGFWDCGVVPGPSDTAIISGGGRVVNVDSPVTVQALSLINGSALHGSETLTVTGTMIWAADVVGGNDLSPPGAEETLVIAAGGVVSLTGKLYGGQVVNYGTIEQAEGTCFTVANNALLNNRPGGLYTVTAGEINSCFPFTPATGRVSNSGTLIKKGAGTFKLVADLTNAGQIEVLSDTLEIWPADGIVMTHTGAFSMAAPGTLALYSSEHNFEPGSAISGQGTFYVTSGAVAHVNGTYDLTGLTDVESTLSFDTPAGEVMLPRLRLGNFARVRGSNDITITQVMTFSQYNAVVEGSTSVSNALNIAPGARMMVNDAGGISFRTLNNYGTIEQASGQCFIIHNDAIFNNHSSGVYRVRNGSMDGCVPFSPVGGVVNNYGHIVKEGPDTFYIQAGIPLTNAGTIEIQDGVFEIRGSHQQTAGETIVSNGSTLRKANYSGSNGNLIFDGGALWGNGFIDLNSGLQLQNNGATINPTGLLNLNADYVQGVSGTLQIDIGGLTPGSEHDQFNVGGQATLDGRLTLAPSGGFTPAAGDVFRVMTYGSHSGEFAEVERGLGLAFGPEYQTEAVVIAADPLALASVTLSASPDSIPAGGTTTSTISATTLNGNSSPMPGQTITFTTNLGTLNPLTAVTSSSGVATTTLSATTAGTATIRGTAAGGAYGQVEVTVAAAAPAEVRLYLPLVVKE